MDTRPHWPRRPLVINTHWHADHVGGNALLQATGAGIAASAQTPRPLPDTNPAAAKPSTSTSRSAPSTIDEPLHDGQILGLGDADWQVLRTPGHTPGHLSLWQPEERLLVWSWPVSVDMVLGRGCC